MNEIEDNTFGKGYLMFILLQLQLTQDETLTVLTFPYVVVDKSLIDTTMTVLREWL